MKSTTRTGSRDGIALIIVLGLLAALIILALSFSISMRTERMATRSFLDVVKSRSLTIAALNRVLAQHIPDSIQGSVYPDWDVLTDGSTGNVFFMGNGDTQSAAMFVPGSLRAEAMAEDGVDWIELRDPLDNTFYGEYAFMVANCSGLVDVNVIGDREDQATPRLNGINPGEIRFGNDVFPTELLNNVAWDTLKQFRTAFGRFESVSELYWLGSTTQFGSYVGPAFLEEASNPGGSPYVDHFHVFSRFPLGFADVGLRANTNVAYIGGDPAEWDFAAITNALETLDPSVLPDINDFVAVMYDYAKEDYEFYGANDNERLDRISSKPVPMINEVIVSNQMLVSASGTGFTLTHQVCLTVETWYPFPDTFGDQFVVKYGSGADVPTITFFPGPYTLVAGTGPQNFTPQPNSFQTNTFIFQASRTVPALPPGSIPFSIAVRLPSAFQVQYAASPNPTVDRVNPEWTPDTAFDLTGNMTLNPGPTPIPLGSAKAFSVNDPRINWDPSNPKQWQATAPTLGQRNSTINGNYPDETTSATMYSRRDAFVSHGEIGFLLYDENRPWETVRLLGENPARGAQILDRLTAFDADTYPRRGMVNVNTRQINSMVATMFGMPIRQYPGGTRTDMTLAQASNIAAHVVDRIDADGPVTNMAHLAERIQAGEIDAIIGSAGDKFKRESVIRNSLGLWGTRHQLFTIFVAARTFSDAYIPGTSNPDDFVTGEQRVIAVVWRDPLETTDGSGNQTHQSYIQFFHWFSGTFE